MDHAAGLCGDQGYMNEWPDLYPGLVISANPGVGLAPWDISKYKRANHRGRVTVDSKPVVFYHYHSLRLMRPRLGFKAVTTAVGNYRFDRAIIDTIYKPYGREVWRASRQLHREDSAIVKALPTIPHIYTNTRNDQFMFQIAGFTVPIDRTIRLLKELYG